MKKNGQMKSIVSLELDMLQNIKIYRYDTKMAVSKWRE